MVLDAVHDRYCQHEFTADSLGGEPISLVTPTATATSYRGPFISFFLLPLPPPATFSHAPRAIPIRSHKKHITTTDSFKVLFKVHLLFPPPLTFDFEEA